MKKSTTYFSIVLIVTILFQLAVIPIHKVFQHRNDNVENNTNVGLIVEESNEHSHCFICDHDHYLPSLVEEIFALNCNLFHYTNYFILWLDNLKTQSAHYHYKLRGPPLLFL